MKRTLLILSLLVILALACASLPFFGNEDNPAVSPKDPGDAANSGGDAGQPGTDSQAGGGEPAAACDNPFYPVETGSTLSYRAAFVTNPDAGLTPEDFSYYQIVTVEKTDETITVQMLFDEVSSEVKWLCGEDGLFSSEYAQFNFTDILDAEIETVSYSGITLPNEEQWFIGSVWDMDFEVNMAYEIEGIEISSVLTGDFANEVVAIESVSVPAGDFPEAYVLETTGSMTINSDMMGSQMTVTVPISTTSWYVKGVGMVKQVSVDETGQTLTELVAYE
jgi:hypothetical protein